MLEIKEIRKVYKTADLEQVALNNVSLNFRDNEFVSILGPSGSGKTTLLNIIGGLDKYDQGDLIINGISTKKYKSKDWDSYRNHTIGFVFQSYNLIPHQTILSNVELALTISGISKKNRKKRALKALDEVGLKEQAHKKPNQMSGGQMQRVAVARALVNNPDILLADEPTGALDSETSIQVMNLLKKIAKDRLVIMVTHNPELAEEYSTRIVKLKDGNIIDDSNPYEVKNNNKVEKYKNLGKASMSLLTAFSLSLNNLLTKKGRTILTSFAGSIGIIGIALILSLSTGFKKYIDKTQGDVLKSYPLTIAKESTNTQSMLMSATENNDKKKSEKNKVREAKNIENMLSTVGKNDTRAFKKHLEIHEEEIKKITTLVNYSYSITPNIYSKDVNDKLVVVNPSPIMSKLMGGASEMFGSNIVSEMDLNSKVNKDSFEVLYGRKAKKFDEIVLLLPDKKHISDLLLYTLGLKDTSNLEDMIKKLQKGEKVVKTNDEKEFTYDDLMNIKLKLILKKDIYKYNPTYNIYEDMSEDKDYMNNLYNNSIDLKVVGILKPKQSDDIPAIASGIIYSPELTKYIIKQTENSELVKKQLNNKEVNVLNGKRFDDKSQDSGMNFQDLIKVDTDMLSSAFNINIDQNYLQQTTENYMGEIGDAITVDTENAKNRIVTNLNEIMINMLNNYIDNNGMDGMEGFASITPDKVEEIVNNYLDSEDVSGRLASLENDYTIPKDVYKTLYNQIITNFLKMYVTLQVTETNPSAIIARDAVEELVTSVTATPDIDNMANELAKQMVEVTMKKTILTKVGELTSKLIETMSTAFNVDQNKIAGAFQFNLTEDDIKRVFSAMQPAEVITAEGNLQKLGYQSLDDPTTISLYFKDFSSKEEFTKFVKKYNKKMKKIDKEKEITYQDIAGLMVSSVKLIVDSVSYVLIAFVSISLIVSSIMIGIITYISVLERTKEIGILRAIGASKKNISSIFNAETVIIGLLSGILGILISKILIIPINSIIHTVTKNKDITAVLPVVPAIILIILSTILTLIGGIIPSRKASKQDPVLALRSE